MKHALATTAIRVAGLLSSGTGVAQKYAQVAENDCDNCVFFVTARKVEKSNGGWWLRMVHMVPSEDLVICRHGGIVDNWDTAFLGNTALRGIE